MSERNPFDLNPSQDLTDLDRFSLVRDDPNAVNTTQQYGQYNMPSAGYGNNVQNPGYGNNTQNPGYGSNTQNPGYGYNMPGNGYNYNGQFNRAAPSNGAVPNQGIYETIQRMEAIRKSVYSRGVFAVIAGIAVFVLMILASMGFNSRISSRSFVVILGIISFVPFLIMIPGMSKKKKELKQLYKATFVYQLLQQHFGNVMYDWAGGFSEIQVKQSGMCRLGNRYHTEDYISAVWNGVHFEQADVKIQYHSSSGKSSSTVTYFEGRMFVFEYSRKMTLPLQVHSKSFRYSGKPDYGMNLEKVEMEDVNFNKRFVVRSTSPHDAFYVLTPQMMQRLTYLEQTYGRITMVIVNGKLYIGIDNRMDSFDPQYMKPIEYLREKERMLADVKVIEDLIQILNCLP